MPDHPDLPDLANYPIAKCPKCGRVLPAAGDVKFEGRTYPVYSCPECIEPTVMEGEELESNLTFLIGPDGRAISPDSL